VAAVGRLISPGPNKQGCYKSIMFSCHDGGHGLLSLAAKPP
jgi:hypothetical protein